MEILLFICQTSSVGGKVIWFVANVSVNLSSSTLTVSSQEVRFSGGGPLRRETAWGSQRNRSDKQTLPSKQSAPSTHSFSPYLLPRRSNKGSLNSCQVWMEKELPENTDDGLETWWARLVARLSNPNSLSLLPRLNNPNSLRLCLRKLY